MAGLSPDRGCDDRWSLINDFVDGEIRPADRSDLEHHLAGCAVCRQTLADLQQIRQVAKGLPPRRPRADAWQRIAQALEAEVPQPQVAQPQVTPPRPWPQRSWQLRPWPIVRVVLPAAAVLALAVASAIWIVREPAGRQQATGAPGPASADQAAAAVHPSTDDLVRTVDEELKAAEAHYDKAISSLEQIARSDQAALEPGVAATLQKNLTIIDGAIRESRAAIQSQPSSQLAQDSLFEALRRKVALLEDTIALINAMRKGDQEGTARAIQGMSKT